MPLFVRLVRCRDGWERAIDYIADDQQQLEDYLRRINVPQGKIFLLKPDVAFEYDYRYRHAHVVPPPCLNEG